MSDKGEKAVCPLCQERLDESIISDKQWYCGHCKLVFDKTEMGKTCPSCGILTRTLGVLFYCEHCGYHREEEWQAFARKHRYPLLGGVLFFSVIALILLGIFHFVFEWSFIVIFLISISMGILIAGSINLFEKRKNPLRLVPEKICALQAAWRKDHLQKVEEIFKTNPDPEIRKSILPYFKDDIERLKSLILTDRSSDVRSEAVKFIKDRHTLMELMKSENQRKVAKATIKQLNISEAEIPLMLTGNLAIIYKQELISGIEDVNLLIELQATITGAELQATLIERLAGRQASLVFGQFQSAKAKGFLTYSKMAELLETNCPLKIKNRMIRQLDDLSIVNSLKYSKFYAQFKKVIDSQLQTLEKVAEYKKMTASIRNPYSYTSKKCSGCGKEVSATAAAGQRCPHCGAYWSYEQNMN